MSDGEATSMSDERSELPRKTSIFGIYFAHSNAS